MIDLETRELRYFVAVAEELHFGRAAARLGIAQPPLSRAVQQLERRLGVTLLDRDRRGVRLTGAGRVLLTEGRAALDATGAAARRARRAAAPRDHLVLAAKAGAHHELLRKLLDAIAAEPDAPEVEMLLCGMGESQRALRDGRADAALLVRPFDAMAGFDTEDLGVEQQMVVLPAGHPLAQRKSLTVAEVSDLPDLPMARWPGPDGRYPAGPGPEVGDQAQLAQLIALGRALVIICESARAWMWSAHAAVPLTDAPPVASVLAWPPHSRSRAVARLIEIATGR